MLVNENALYKLLVLCTPIMQIKCYNLRIYHTTNTPSSLINCDKFILKKQPFLMHQSFPKHAVCAYFAAPYTYPTEWICDRLIIADKSFLLPDDFII